MIGLIKSEIENNNKIIGKRNLSITKFIYISLRFNGLSQLRSAGLRKQKPLTTRKVR